jgi:hypothetical protein
MAASDFFEQEIQQRLEDYFMRPGERLWDRIESDLRNQRRNFQIFKRSFLLFIFIAISISFPEMNCRYLYSNCTSEYIMIDNPISASIVPTPKEPKNIDLPSNNKLISHIQEDIIQLTPPDTKYLKEYIDYRFSNLYKQVDLNISKYDIPTFIQPTAMNRIICYNKTIDENISLSDKKQKDKQAFCFYLLPTMSERAFKIENINNSNPLLSGFNNQRVYKPSIGWEFGFSFLRTINPIVQIRYGVQFNYNSYAIMAVQGAPALANLSLNSSGRTQRLSNLENRSGIKSQAYSNRNYQFSLPFGVMIKLNKSQRSNLIVGISVQPSYLMNTSAYLLSTDLRNYIEAPDMVRRWNIHSSTELLYTKKIGQYRIIAGPQIRFQHLSANKKDYPFKENLIEYGLKIGLIRDIP